MINAKIYSIYCGTPHLQHVPWIRWVDDIDDSDIVIFSNFCVYKIDEVSTDKPRIAIMLEPRSMKEIDERYLFLEKNYHKFTYILTFDSILLKKCDNAKLFIWGGVWDWVDKSFPIREKTKHISMISSNKEYCELHTKRTEMIREFEANYSRYHVDCYGTFNGGPQVSTLTAHKEYMFSVVLENYIDDYWFTEKICNCFACKVVPIYYGARRIDDFFNRDGIIKVSSLEEVYEVVEKITEDDYLSRKDAIEDNYNRARTFSDTWNLLRVMYCDEINKIERKEPI